MADLLVAHGEKLGRARNGTGGDLLLRTSPVLAFTDANPTSERHGLVSPRDHVGRRP